MLSAVRNGLFYFYTFLQIHFCHLFSHPQFFSLNFKKLDFFIFALAFEYLTNTRTSWICFYLLSSNAHLFNLEHGIINVCLPITTFICDSSFTQTQCLKNFAVLGGLWFILGDPRSQAVLLLNLSGLHSSWSNRAFSFQQHF